MKEKRVDVYLAKVAFYQLIFLGFGGAFVTELAKYHEARLDILIASGVTSLIMGVTIGLHYSKVSRLVTKHKN